MQRLLTMLSLSFAIAIGLAAAAPARAQVLGQVQGLPSVQVPGAGVPGLPTGLPLQPVDNLLQRPLALLRKLQIRSLLRKEPRRVDVDPHGDPILRGQFLGLSLSATQLDAARAAGFAVEHAALADSSLGLDLVVLRDKRGRSTAEALRVLQQAAPGASFSYQHLYLPAGGGDGGAEDPPTPGSPAAVARRVGLIDGGVDPSDKALKHAHVEQHGCATPTVSRHGSAVAERLVAGDADTLYAADLWCDDDVGGATSSLIDALAWMAREHVPVINISLVGPDNPVLARAVQVMVARGHLLVSAVGNDGPAAPPLFPAAYPGVIGVSGVDARDRVLPESGSGEQVAFCASGVIGRGRNAMRGTSFASPIVARRAARLLDAPREGAAAWIEQRLAPDARDLGAPGRDPRYGLGLLSP